ncbi:hypothetical protein GCM10027176_52060 [Actinoallomurus bryophytorum]
MELCEPRSMSADDVTRSLHSETSRSENRQQDTPLWEEAGLTPVELTDLAEWTLARHATLLSAVMSRINILWRHWDNRAELDIDKFTGRPRLSWWDGPSTRELANLLTSSAIEIRGARWAHAHDETLLIAVGDALLELRGPSRELAEKEDINLAV